MKMKEKTFIIAIKSVLLHVKIGLTVWLAKNVNALVIVIVNVIHLCKMTV